MEALDGLLRGFLAVMAAKDKTEFRRFGLEPLLSIRHMKLETTLLTTTTYFWDPQIHVFRFNYEELCPTMEEFCALFGVSPAGPFILPTPHSDYSLPSPTFLAFLKGM